MIMNHCIAIMNDTMSSGLASGIAPGNSPTVKSIKVISMGAPRVGKSCLIKRYCEKRFVSKYMATLGIDYGVTTIKSKGNKVKVNIFDMGGEPFFYEVRNEFYKGTNGAVLVYDVTDRTTFDSLSGWISEMKTHLSSQSEMDKIVILVCGNKTDLPHRQVDSVEAKLWAESRGFFYYETSALANEHVLEMFECLFDRIISVLSNNKPARIIGSNYTVEQVELVKRVLKTSSTSCDILGIKSNASRDDVIKAYKQLAVLLHPDKNPVPGSEEAFKKLSSAKDELLNNNYQ